MNHSLTKKICTKASLNCPLNRLHIYPSYQHEYYVVYDTTFFPRGGAFSIFIRIKVKTTKAAI